MIEVIGGIMVIMVATEIIIIAVARYGNSISSEK